jgi:serine/threonine-protein kinase ATR
MSNEELHLLQQQCTYKLLTVSHALRHASSLLSIMTTPLGPQRLVDDIVSSFLECLPWVLDSHFAFYEVQVRWRAVFPSCISMLLRNVLQLIAAFQDLGDIDSSLKQKANSLLVLLAIESAEHYDQLHVDAKDADSAEQLFCSTLITVAGLCKKHEPTLRLVASQLIPCLEKLSIHADIMSEGTDSRVSMRKSARSGLYKILTKFDRDASSY